jgi:hypothetical protein
VSLIISAGGEYRVGGRWAVSRNCPVDSETKPDPQPAGFAAARDPSIRQKRIEIADNAAARFKKYNAGIGWTNSMPMTLKQGDADARFQIPDTSADGGGTDAEERAGL